MVLLADLREYRGCGSTEVAGVGLEEAALGVYDELAVYKVHSQNHALHIFSPSE
jgi:hypothetical protein